MTTLNPQSMKLLDILHEHVGEFVSYDEIARRDPYLAKKKTLQFAIRQLRVRLGNKRIRVQYGKAVMLAMHEWRDYDN